MLALSDDRCIMERENNKAVRASEHMLQRHTHNKKGLWSDSECLYQCIDTLCCSSPQYSCQGLHGTLQWPDASLFMLQICSLSIIKKEGDKKTALREFCECQPLLSTAGLKLNY